MRATSNKQLAISNRGWKSLILSTGTMFISAAPVSAHAGDASCTKQLLPGFPHWGKGLHFDIDCNLKNFSLSDVWLVVGNLVQMALFLAGLLSVIFIIVGGIMFITSAGNPDSVGRARKLLMNAALGLTIAVLASTIMGFVISLLT